MKSLTLIMIVLMLISGSASCSRGADNTNTVTNRNSATTGAASNAANSASKEDYPQDVVNEFLKGCEGAGSDRRFCGCMLAKVQAKYSFEEFSAIEAKISAGEPPDEFVEFSGKARAECMK